MEYCAFNPGAAFRGLHDSLVNFTPEQGAGPGVIQVCHEEISVALAHGYYRATGRPMVAIAHDVVGLQHATMAIFNAWVDRAPVLVLGGTGPMDSTRRRPWIDWVHTANVQGNLVRDFAKFDDQPATLAAVPDSLYRAVRTMLLEPPGSAYVCFDAAVQEQETAAGLTIPDRSAYVSTTQPGADAIPHLVQLAELLAAPVLCTDEQPVIYGVSAAAVPGTARLLRSAKLGSVDHAHDQDCLGGVIDRVQHDEGRAGDRQLAEPPRLVPTRRSAAVRVGLEPIRGGDDAGGDPGRGGPLSPRDLAPLVAQLTRHAQGPGDPHSRPATRAPWRTRSSSACTAASAAPSSGVPQVCSHARTASWGTRAAFRAMASSSACWHSSMDAWPGRKARSISARR